MREHLDQWNGADIHGVARDFLKCTNTALTEDNVAIAMGENVLGGQEPLFDGCRHPTLEYDWFLSTPDLIKQDIVLHIAGADLQNIGVLADH